MKGRFSRLARRLAHVQAQALFAVLFYGLLAPYACLFRFAVRRSTRSGGWFPVEDQVSRLEALRRLF